MKNLYQNDYEKVLDYVVLGTTSGLKREDSKDRLLALKAMQRIGDIMFENTRNHFEERHKKAMEKLEEAIELLNE